MASGKDQEIEKETMGSTRILLVEDHHVVRQALKVLLELEPDFRIVGEAYDGLDALRLVDRLRPKVVVLDLRLPGLHGQEVTREITRRSPQTRIVILSVHADERHAAEALKNGAVGYVPKSATAEELVYAIRQVAAGARYLSPSLSEPAVQAYIQDADGAPRDAYATLTARERQVMYLVVEGHTSAEVASRLSIGTRTVESHRANLMHKLGVRNLAELIRYAFGRGLCCTEGIA
jgi:DNA-binding NarL/FixJ family response regulator